MATQASVEWIFNVAGSAASASLAKSIKDAGGSEDFAKYVVARFYDNYKDSIDDSGIYNACMGRARTVDKALSDSRLAERNEEWHTNLATIRRLDLELAELKLMLSNLGMKREERVLNSMFSVTREEGRSSNVVMLKQNAVKMIEEGKLKIKVEKNENYTESLKNKIEELECMIDAFEKGKEINIALDAMTGEVRLDGDSCSYNSTAAFVSTIMGTPIKMYDESNKPLFDVGKYINPKHVIDKMIESEIPIFKSDYRNNESPDFDAWNENSNLKIVSVNDCHAICVFKFENEWWCFDDGRLRKYDGIGNPLIVANSKFQIDRILISGDIELNPGPNALIKLNDCITKYNLKIICTFNVNLDDDGSIMYICYLKVGSAEATGNGCSKKEAKRRAAVSILDQLGM
ncbi:nonstructural protein 3 [Bovine rotavirus C]|uniref:Non-structural protein 3 n=1 Tax=Bovine rotavirus C TaxID=31588 RepID=A0A060NHB4_9REOV|nr:nonstructural protein 3 [Bovine rotavirus C]BAO73971.1 nonstructural protein 3 [Bovine rotavirus C]